MKFEIIHGSLYMMDGNDIIDELTEPSAIVYIDENPTLSYVLKIGNFDRINEIYQKKVSKLIAADMEDELQRTFIVPLPKDTEILSKIMNFTGYLGKFLVDNNLLGFIKES